MAVMRSTSASPSRHRMNLVELEEKVLELERYKREEEAERARDQARRKRELNAARRKLQQEIRRTHVEVRHKTAEVEAIERAVLKVQENEERALERQTRANQRFEKRVTELETRAIDKAQILQDRMLELGLARGRLAHLQFVLRSLEDGGPAEKLFASMPAIQNNTEEPAEELRGQELTASLQKEVQQLHAEEKRLERENDMLQEELCEVRWMLDQGEKASPMEPTAALSRATTRVPSGLASPSSSNPFSATSAPGGLASLPSASRVYSPVAGSFTAAPGSVTATVFPLRALAQPTVPSAGAVPAPVVQELLMSSSNAPTFKMPSAVAPSPLASYSVPVQLPLAVGSQV